MIRVKQKGNLSKVSNYLIRVKEPVKPDSLDRYGQEGVVALSAATPKDTGLTSNSWEYKINKTRGSVSISFYNTNIQNGVPVAIILQYGHATKNGKWVEGIDYINPALKPLFERIANDVWEEVTKV